MTSRMNQKSLTTEFMGVTSMPEKVASRFLKASNWKLDQAIDSYYTSTGSAPPSAKEKENLAKLFETYRVFTDDVDAVSVDGIMRWLSDLGINLESAEIMVPLEIVQAPALGEMTKDGFVNGWKNVNCDTIEKQKAYLDKQIRLLSSDMALFKRVYRHAFIASKERASKAMPLENAIVYWELLFDSPGKKWVTGSTNWTQLWIEFLNAKWTKSVNRDMWNQTFEFFLKTLQDESLGFWSEDGAWPGVIDDFVAYVREKKGIVPDTMETD